MRHSRAPFYLLVALLFFAGISLTWYRHSAFDIPFAPDQTQIVWSVEAKILFQADGRAVSASLAIPSDQPGFEVLQEFSASPGYGFAFTDGAEKNALRRAQWTVRSALGPQILYYRADILERDDDRALTSPNIPKLNQYFRQNGPQETLALQLLKGARARSADNFTLARELILEFNRQAEQAAFLRQQAPREYWLVSLLHQAKVPARKVALLQLKDGRRRQQLQSYLQVFDGEKYQIFNIENAQQGMPEKSLLWEKNSQSLLDLMGGEQSSVYFSMLKQELPAGVKARSSVNMASPLLDFSIHSLPLEEQTLFKGILLIPFGVLVVCLLRVFVGIRTSGTFMPVLIAIAFIQTTLVVGLVGFVVIVGVGLLIRSYLSQLNLLLVSRISAVIISVIILIAFFSVVANQLGLTEGLKVTFFPMIILSWTIERMSILWEEEGPREVFIQVGGSLFVAVLTYMLMMNPWVRHFTFNFLGVQFIVMAVVLLLGNYKGYRLLEFKRFAPMLTREPNDDANKVK